MSPFTNATLMITGGTGVYNPNRSVFYQGYARKLHAHAGCYYAEGYPME